MFYKMSNKIKQNNQQGGTIKIVSFTNMANIKNYEVLKKLYIK